MGLFSLAETAELFDLRGGMVDKAMPPEVEPLRNLQGDELRPVNMIVSDNGDGGMVIGAGSNSRAVRSLHEDNTAEGFIACYIKSAIDRKLAPFKPSLVKHDGHMVIVGSGPSVADHVEEIRAEQALGRPVMAIKGAHDWLVDRGITPDLWVSMDSQDKIVEGVRKKSKETCYLPASKVSPVVLDWLNDVQVVVWHAWMGTQDVTQFPEGECLVGGGSTSGLRGVTLSWLMGFRRVILYGFDSCLKAGAKRVNGDKPEQWCMTMQAGILGPVRMCDASMASQAAEFEALTFGAMPGLKVKVVGDGLLADIMVERQRLGFNDW